MTHPPLNELKKIVVVKRDDVQDYPFDSLQKLLNRAQIELVDHLTQIHQDVDLVIALGGDGTVLKALGLYPLVPTLAVNFGRVGFLTQCNRDEIDKALVRLLSDEYRIEDRFALEIEYRGDVIRCINEVVLKSIAHMVELTLSVDGCFVRSLRGDGVIIGTPTGSTAYLMSTGAPLVTPGVKCMIATPLNEYRFSSRTMILPPESEIHVRVDQMRELDLVGVIDGGDRLPLETGESILIRQSPHPTRLVTFEPHYFFRNLRERLDW
jgi:NAD+ kinase